MTMSLKQRKIKFEPRIELNHNIYLELKLTLPNSCLSVLKSRNSKSGSESVPTPYKLSVMEGNFLKLLLIFNLLSSLMIT